MWTLTGFADEISRDLDEQIALLTKLGIKHVEFRSAWGTKVLDLTPEQLDEAKAKLDAAGIAVLLDDRKASPGVKFTDAELLGMPTSVVVGRTLADGIVEVRDRVSGEKSEVAADAVADQLIALLRS